MTDQAHNCRHDDQTKSNIEKYGLTVIILGATEYLPAFAYSIGLWKTFKHPEIICFGLTTKNLHALINDVAELVKQGQIITTNKNYDDFFDNSDTKFLNVDPSYFSHYFGAAINFYNSDRFPALQFVWTDRNNRFPWDNDFEEELKYRQPLLDRNIDFKFREAKNLGIFTTRQWLELDKPILRVVHDEDGDWQFLTGDQMPDDIKLVALEQMTLRDKTLNELFDLDYGEEAEREFIGSEWIRATTQNDDE
ncbi:DUF4262 domain-containing protein [Dyadobacter sp. CY312]|uniref:DUF4262 domain-containing protein n=1 Tax=Dyadobacter sp. CY312 TaxID=2907303 RepID=UPI001F37CEDF|nr:DUF4262 domain-containing protein [Dyadobacter sp. CY312]MCE7043091.1 DUF4262 domain-containing protein [Dyadobacter sp. CY312]